MGEYELAEDNLRSAVNRDQTDPTVHMHLGDLYEKTGRIRLAAAQWELSLADFAKSRPPTLNKATLPRYKRSWKAPHAARQRRQFSRTGEAGIMSGPLALAEIF